MEQQILSLFDWRLLLFVAIATSFITEAFKKVTPPWFNGNVSLAVASLIITLLRLPLKFSTVADWQTFLLNVIVTMAVAILFYSYLGRYVVDGLFNFLKKKFDKETEVGNGQ